MNTKLKTITIYATLETELYLDVNVPESATADQIEDFIRNEGIERGDMKQNESPGSGWWTWYEDFNMCVDFDPKAKDISEHFLDKKEVTL
jgi:hypothetical protein